MALKDIFRLKKRTASEDSVVSPAETASSQSSVETPLRCEEELVPAVALLNAQQARVYAEGSVLVNVEVNTGPEMDQDLFYSPAEAILRGTSLLLVSDSATKPTALDVLEAAVAVHPEHCALVLSASHRAAHHLKFSSVGELQRWVGAVCLARYEHTRLSLCYSAALLSAKAPLLADLHVVMAEQKFAKEEWVSIKFSRASHWRKCYMVVTPAQGVAFYSSARTAKRNLICAVSNAQHVHAVYPSVPELIDTSALLRIHGDVTLHNIGPAQNDVVSPVQSPPQSPKKHSRHTSMSSLSSMTSTKSTKGVVVENTTLYVLPLQHGGVKPYETLIRVFLPLLDAFKLYGRPARLVPDKRTRHSLLFGMPSLPKVKLLTVPIAQTLLADNWDLIINDPGIYGDLFDAKMASLFEDPAFEGFGSLQKDSTQNLEHPYSSRRMSLSSTSSTPRFQWAPSDLPAQLTEAQIQELQKSSLEYSKNIDQQQQFTQGHLRVASITSGRSRAQSRASQLRTESYTNMQQLLEPIDI